MTSSKAPTLSAAWRHSASTQGGASKGTCVHMRVTAAPPCYLSARDCCAAVLPFACGHSLPASRTVLRPLRPMTVRARVPCMHSDPITRAQSSAAKHPDRPGKLGRGLELVTCANPPVTADRTVDDAKSVRLAERDLKDAVEQARRRGRKARAKAKRLNEAMARLNEAIHLINRLISLFHKPLSTAGARECKSELDGLELNLMPPMATVVFQLTQSLPDLAAFWTAPFAPRDPEAETPASPRRDASSKEYGANQDET